jgi:hypothetical protein
MTQHAVGPWLPVWSRKSLAWAVDLRLVAGVAEPWRSALVFIIAQSRNWYGAMTLGHVIVGLTRQHRARCERIEHAHVRQYELWGPFSCRAYALSSLWQVKAAAPNASNFF